MQVRIILNGQEISAEDICLSEKQVKAIQEIIES